MSFDFLFTSLLLLNFSTLEYISEDSSGSSFSVLTIDKSGTISSFSTLIFEGSIGMGVDIGWLSLADKLLPFLPCDLQVMLTLLLLQLRLLRMVFPSLPLLGLRLLFFFTLLLLHLLELLLLCLLELLLLCLLKLSI